MSYEAIVIGTGLSGLTAASLLAKRGVKVLVIEKQFKPGGSCGIFKRGDAIFDQGTAMLFGFGEKGFNPFRFLFNCLEEPIDMIRHDLLYTVVYEGRRIRFFADIDQFVEELAAVFPSQRQNLREFYRDMQQLYTRLLVESPMYTAPDEIDRQAAARQFRKYPLAYLRFLTYLFRSAESLLKQYFDDPAIFRFFDKLTSTYCYTTVAETPAALAAVMFVDNHVGGSFYPAGSTLFLPGKLEKVIEENGGEMLYGQQVRRILIEKGRAAGVELADGTRIASERVIYSGTIWNLYGQLIEAQYSTRKRRFWASAMLPTYPSVVYFALVEQSVIPAGTSPVEMLVGNPSQLDESEITVYLFSLDDRTLCPPCCHVLMAIGPSLRKWPSPDDQGHTANYLAMKEAEKKRLVTVLEKRFPGFSKAIHYDEISTPTTIERYTLKNGGCVAGPKQNMGQHMFRRLHTRTEWPGLYACGESTVMGTGAPAVAVSGISAANAVLKDTGRPHFTYDPARPDVVRILPHPVTAEMLYQNHSPAERELIRLASKCQYCEDPPCMAQTRLDIRGIMRRAAVGNFSGASKLIDAWPDHDRELAPPAESDLELVLSEQSCIRMAMMNQPVAIRQVIGGLTCLEPLKTL